jgi:hypothetical protein
MLPTILLAAFLLAHGLIHASFLSPRPSATAGGPAWPFDLGRSWILSPLGAPSRVTRVLGLALVVATVGGYALAAVVALGVGPGGLWIPAVILGAAPSLALLLLYFHPWLALGVAIDVVLVWVVTVGAWTPRALPL